MSDGAGGRLFEQVVVPLDGSEWAERALPHARAAAQRLGAGLWLVSAAPEGERDAREERLQAVSAGLGLPLRVTVEVSDDPAGFVVGLVDGARVSGGPVLVCMTTRARRMATALWGSTAVAVVRESVGPVLLVGPAAADRGPVDGPVLVPLDGSEMAEQALPLAVGWARATGQRVELRQVLDPETVEALGTGAGSPPDIVEGAYLERLADGLEGVEVNWDVLHDDDPAPAIVRAAADLGAGSIVMATHGRSGAALAVAGSVALAVVHDAPCPALVQRPTGYA
jgi:nucleotide-binding universal stress UspA family protein